MKIILSWKDPEHLDHVEEDLYWKVEKKEISQEDKDKAIKAVYASNLGEQIDIEFDTETKEYRLLLKGET